MEAIVLAGGRGRRMGALTEKRSKAGLEFMHKPLVTHVIEGLLVQDAIHRIVVACGYRSVDVHEAVEQYHGSLVKKGKIRYVDSTHLVGNLDRLAYTLAHEEICDECFVCGINVLLPPSALERVFTHVREIGATDVVMPVSPYTEVAPSHPRMTLNENGTVREYLSRPGSTMFAGSWYSSLGMRYLGGRAIEEIKDFPDRCVNFTAYARARLDQGRPIDACIVRERWHHFGVPEDLLVNA